MSVAFLSRPHRETAADRVSSLRWRLERLKDQLGELESDIEKCTDKEWLDIKTLKRLDKAMTVMKVGYKIAKRGMNRDKKFGDAAKHDDPTITESDLHNAETALTETALDRSATTE